MTEFDRLTDSPVAALKELPPGEYTAKIEVDSSGRYWAVGTGKAAGRRWAVYPCGQAKSADA